MTVDASLNKRLRRVVRKHERMKMNGTVHKVGRDGLIHTRPRLVKPQFPLKGLIVTLVLLVGFKAVLFAQNDSGNYEATVETLRAGTAVERVGAFVMQEDPVTSALGGYIKQYFFEE